MNHDSNRYEEGNGKSITKAIVRAGSVYSVGQPTGPREKLSVEQRERLCRLLKERMEEDRINFPGFPKGTTDKAIADVIGLSSATVNAIRNPKQEKDYAVTSMIALRRYLGMTIDDILGLRPLKQSSAPPVSHVGRSAPPGPKK